MRRGLAITCAFVLSTACGGPDPACDVTLEPGDTDAAALSAALSALRDGQTACLAGGTFALDAPLVIEGGRAVTIAGAGLDSPEGTVLDFTGYDGTEAALAVSGVPRFALRDLTIESPPAAGVVLADSDEARVERLTVVWDPDLRRGGDGLRVEESSRVLVSSSDFLGGGAAGVRLVRAEGSLVERSGAFDNVVGFSLEDSEGCELREVAAEVNVTGVLIADDPSDAARSLEITLRDSTVLENGLPSEDRSDPLFGLLPEGVGVVILAADDTELSGNAIEGHASAGVLVLSYATLVELAGAPAASDPAYDPQPELVHLHDDTFVENGFDPAAATDPLVTEVVARTMREQLADVVWDGAVAGGGDPSTVCVRPAEGSAATFLDLDARGGFAAPSDDPAPHECSHPGHGLVEP